MTPFEFIVSMLLTAFGFLVCVFNEKWWVRGISAFIVFSMSYFAGFNGGVIK